MTDETPPSSVPDGPPVPEAPPAPLLPPAVSPPPTVPAPDGPPTGAEGVAPAPVSAARRSRRGLALAVTAVLVVVAAGGGIGYAVLRHQDGKPSATPTATLWTPPSPTATMAFGAKSGGSHYGSLALLLLPMPEHYTPGPDVNEFGNDVVLSGGQAEKLVKGDVSALPKKQRKRVGTAVDALHIQGVGLRTYTERDGNLVVQMEIVQMKNKEAAHAGSRFFGEFTEAMGSFRHGPKVKGHPHATCVLPPTDPGEKLDTMTCQATEGDLMVTMTADGTVPLEKDEAVKLLAEQLDRIQDPGEAV